MRLSMDWRAIRFDWNRARAFLVTAEEGSLSGAARALGMAQPTLGRQVTALEEELGVILFERRGGRLALTQAGLELLEHVRDMGDAALHVSRTASGQSQSIEGLVSVTASEIMAAHVLPPILATLRRAHPGVTIELIASNATSDLRRREADIAIRNAEPRDPELIATRVRTESARLYAAHSYFDRVGAPKDNQALSKLEFIGLQENQILADGLNVLGLSVGPESFPLISSSQLASWELVKGGLGVGVMITEVGDAEPLVAQAGPWLPAFEFNTWLLAHREITTSRRIRLVFDHLVAALKRRSSGA